MQFATPLPISRIEPKGEFQSGAAVREFALAAERAGLGAVCISEHPAPDSHWLHNDPAGHDCLDPFTALAFVAAATTELKVYSNIVVLPFRNPFITAKAASTLQVLSDNRFILGVGIGYQEAEFSALGVPYKERGFLTDEALETIRLIWAGGPVTKKGRYFEATGNEARPVPSPTPPIWVGGAADKVLERAAKFGDGWVPHFTVATNDPVVMAGSMASIEAFADKVKRIQDLRAKLGKTGPFDFAPGAPFRLKSTTPADAQLVLDTAGKLKDAGANWFWPHVPYPSRAAFIENLAWLGEEVIAKFDK